MIGCQAMTLRIPLLLTAEIVPFAICTERLAVLLVQQATTWRLPGGPVGGEEDLDAAARRHLAEQTGLGEIYLEQLYTFGEPNRDSGQRAVAVAYYALVRAGFSLVDAVPAIAETRWVAVDDMPVLALDHAAIVTLARRRLAAKLAYSTIALQLMPECFTLSQLQAVHEIILGELLDKRNFRKRILALDCIEATGEMARQYGHRPARLFRAKRPGQVDFIK
jgi:8-oxo-dGTP diphosphatase